MRSNWIFFGLNASMLLAGGWYITRLGQGVEQKLDTMTKAIEGVGEAKAGKSHGSMLTANAVREAAERGTLNALAAINGGAADPREVPAEASGETEGSPARDNSPTPSPEMIQAFDEANRTVTAALERKVWTAQDLQQMKERMPVIDPVSREELMRRLVHAVNAQQLNTDATLGRLF